MIKFGFRKSDNSTYENMVSRLTGKFVHVDLIIEDRAYSAYVGEPFSENDVDTNDPLYEYLELSVSPDEQHAVKTWVCKLVEDKIPYNNSDIVYCVLPSLYMPDTDHEKVKAVFCSQVIVLALRAFVDNEELQKKLAKINSRTCSPQKLYGVLKEFCI